jgi:hypothetical protein
MNKYRSVLFRYSSRSSVSKEHMGPCMPVCLSCLSYELGIPHGFPRCKVNPGGCTLRAPSPFSTRRFHTRFCPSGTFPPAFAPFGLPHFGALPTGFAANSFAPHPHGLSFAGLETPGLLPSQDNNPGLERTGSAPEGPGHPRAWPLPGTMSPGDTRR